MRPRIHIVVPIDIVNRGERWGIDIVKWYKRTGAVARSGNRGTQFNQKLQAEGKIGECALARYLGISMENIKWNVEKPDNGWDIKMPCGILIDVKTSAPPFKLIWSVDINDLYEEKKFHLLVSVSIAANHRDCWVEGWVTKDQFRERRMTSDGKNSRLELGTWFMDKNDLSPITDLLSKNVPSRLSIRSLKQAERILGPSDTAWLEGYTLIDRNRERKSAGWATA